MAKRKNQAPAGDPVQKAMEGFNQAKAAYDKGCADYAVIKNQLTVLRSAKDLAYAALVNARANKQAAAVEAAVKESQS